MLKKIGFSAAALAFGFFGLVANGCSSSSTTVTGDDGGSAKDSSKEATAPADTGPATCYDVTAVDYLLLGPPVAYQDVCQGTDIQDYLTACFSPGTQATCTAYTESHPFCSQCIDGNAPTSPDGGVLADAGVGPDGGAFLAPYPALLPTDQTGGVVSNIDGCIAALSTGTDTCKLTDTQLSNCIAFTCSTCADQATQDACDTQSAADPAGCSAKLTIDSACQTALTASQSANAAACGGSATTFNDQFAAVAGVLCGKAP